MTQKFTLFGKSQMIELHVLQILHSLHILFTPKRVTIFLVHTNHQECHDWGNHGSNPSCNRPKSFEQELKDSNIVKHLATDVNASQVHENDLLYFHTFKDLIQTQVSEPETIV